MLAHPLEVALVSARTPLRSSLTLAMNLNISPSMQKTGMFNLLSLALFFGTYVFIFLDSIDEKEVIEISDDEMEGEDDDELAPTPRSHRTGPPSTPSPVKASFVLFHLPIYIFFAIYSALYF